MTAYRYTAITLEGKKKKGSIEADSERQVRQRLREQQLSALEVVAIKESESSTPRTRGFQVFKRTNKRLFARDLALITRQLATLLKAGIAIDAALESIAKQSEKAHIQAILLGVRSQVCEGHGLASALAQFPKSFPTLYQATVSAGERTGNLESILFQLADYIDKQHDLKQKIMQALLYPSIMCCVAFGVVTFLLIAIVPKIVAVFTQSQQTLPLATTLLIHISKCIQQDGLILLLALIVIFFGIKRSLKNQNLRFRLDRFLLSLPFIGKTITLINTTRFARTLGILSSANVSILECLTVATKLVHPLPMQQAITQARHDIREGSGIAIALQKTHYFTPLFLHLLSSGESNGELGPLLQQCASQQQHDIELVLANSLTLFEPLLILIMGGIVLFIVLAIMLPIFNMDTMF